MDKTNLSGYNILRHFSKNRPALRNWYSVPVQHSLMQQQISILSDGNQTLSSLSSLPLFKEPSRLDQIRQFILLGDSGILIGRMRMVWSWRAAPGRLGKLRAGCFETSTACFLKCEICSILAFLICKWALWFGMETSSGTNLIFGASTR